MSTDHTATGTDDPLLTNGSASIVTTHHTTGPQTITATSTTNPAIFGAATVNITAATFNHFLLEGPLSAAAGTGFSFTVTPKVEFGNDVNYSGTIEFTSTDLQQPILPPAATVSGTGPFPFTATLKTVRPQTITATDSANSSIHGSLLVNISAAAAIDHFLVSGPVRTTAGTASTSLQQQKTNSATRFKPTRDR